MKENKEYSLSEQDLVEQAPDGEKTETRLEKLARYGKGVVDAAMIMAILPATLPVVGEYVNFGLRAMGKKNLKHSWASVNREGLIEQNSVKSMRRGVGGMVLNKMVGIRTPEKTEAHKNSSQVFVDTLNMVLQLEMADKKGNERTYKTKTHEGMLKNLRALEDAGMIQITKSELNGKKQNVARAEISAGNFSRLKDVVKGDTIDQYDVEFVVKNQDLTPEQLLKSDVTKFQRLGEFVRGGDFKIKTDEDGRVKSIVNGRDKKYSGSDQ